MLIVLVGRVARPVTTGSNNLAGQQVGGGYTLHGQAVVVYLTRAVPRTAQVNTHGLLGVVSGRQVLGGHRRGESKATTGGAGDGQLLTATNIEVVGYRLENPGAAS